MTIHNVSAYLQSFEAVAAPFSPSPSDAEGRPDAAPVASPAETMPLAEVEAMRLALEEAFEMRLQQEREAHEEALRFARAQWTRSEADALGERLSQALNAGIAALRADVARIITPFVSHAIAERSLDDFVHAIRRAIAGEHGALVTISGPEDLVARIGDKLEADRVAIRKAPSAAIDVAADLAEARIETRLGAWMRRLKQMERDAS